MSAIVGVFYFDGKPVEHVVPQQMLEIDAIKRYGNDATGIWVEDSIGMGQRALWTTSEQELEIQPLIDKSSGIVMVLDGRVDNRTELIHELNKSGVNSPIVTDADIILNAYKVWGESCLTRIIGDFAFVIWDNYKKQLLCARDPLGVRTFYYYIDNSLFAFATDAEAFFKIPDVVKCPNLDTLVDNLLNNYYDSKQTEFKNVYRLRPAHLLIVKEHSIQTFQYWDIDLNKKIRLSSHEEYKEAFLEQFTKSITSKIRTNRDLGVIFSGGLDSSSILCLIEYLKSQGEVSKNICGYSILFGNVRWDESHYMRSVQEKWGTKIYWLHPQPPTPIWDQTEILNGTTQSISNPMMYTMEAVFKEAAKNGTNVLLSGHGGDDFMDSNLSIANQMLLRGNLLKSLKYVLSVIKFQEVPFSYAFNTLVYGPLASVAPKWLKKIYRSFNPKKTYKWICEPFAKEALDRLSSKPWHSFDRPSIGPCYKANYNITHDGHRISTFERWNRLSGSVELRHPFCDRRLVELAVSIPDEQMVYGGEPKGLLRRAMATKLPELVRYRKDKADFGELINKWIFIDNATYVKTLLKAPYLEELGLINTEIASTIYNDCCNKGIKKLDWDISEGFIQLLLLEAWARSAFKNEHLFSQLHKTDSKNPAGVS